MVTELQYGFRVTYPGSEPMVSATTEDAARRAVERLNDVDGSPAAAELVVRDVTPWRVVEEPEPVGCLECGHAVPHDQQRGFCRRSNCDCDGPVWPDGVRPA